MDISGSYTLNANRWQVWNAMMDPGVLTQCIPACQHIDKRGDDCFYAKVKVKFGFIPVRFKVKVDLSSINPPESYALSAEGEGGIAQAARAMGKVAFLPAADDTTIVNFTGRVMPGSQLIELGEPLIHKTANRWFKRFFEHFEAALLTRSVDQ